MDANELIRAKETLRAILETTDTSGWDHIVSDAVTAIEEFKEVMLAAQSWDEVNFLKGRIEQLRMMTVLRDLVTTQLSALENEDLSEEDESYASL
jgi:hypothetical protein